VRISEPILIEADTPWDPGPFVLREYTKVGVNFYSDAAGSTAAKLPASAGGVRDGSYRLVERASATGDAETPYLETAALMEGTGVTTMLLAGGKWETIVELGGMSRVEVVAAQQGPPDDAAGAVSYRIWVEVEDAQ